MKHTNHIRTVFHAHLRTVSLTAWILKLIPIPIGLWTAGWMARLVKAAADADMTAAVRTGIAVLTVLFCQKLFDILTGIAYQKKLLKATQKCKLTLYRRFLASPLHELYTARHGEIMEHFHEDFQTTVNRTTVLLPSFCCALVQTGVYFGYLALQDPWIALVLLGLSAIQLVPPMVVKKYMERNYNDCCEMDEVILDYTMQAYHGFSAIRMYGLKSWWQNGLKALHKEYIRIGNRSTITGTAENTMNSFVEHILRYGSYGIMGIFVLTEFAPMETALEAIALSAGFFGAVKTAAGSIPAFAVSRKAEERLSPWFAEDKKPPAAIHSAGISMEKLSCTLGDKKILTELTDTLDLSRITLLKGKNGAGKSTLMRLLIGLLVPDAGIVQVDGVSPEMFCGDTYPRKLFYLPQEDAVYHMTPMELYRMLTEDAVSKAVSIAVRFGLTAEQLAENDIDTMSGGERKKVFLTLAFTLDPVILLLDEPTNSLDDAGRKELCTLLKERKSGALIITHDPILDSAADRIVILTQGGLHHEK